MRWYFWFPCLTGVVGPFDTEREARQYVRANSTPYQRRNAVYTRQK